MFWKRFTIAKVKPVKQSRKEFKLKLIYNDKIIQNDETIWYHQSYK